MNHSETASGKPDETAQLLALGISNKPYTVYHCGGYCYSNRADAVAQSQRPPHPETVKQPDAGNAEITEQVVDCFHFRSFRYSNAADAVAASRRAVE